MTPEEIRKLAAAVQSPLQTVKESIKAAEALRALATLLDNVHQHRHEFEKCENCKASLVRVEALTP